MAGIYETIFTAVKNALTNDSVLTTYVKAIYGGVRTDIPKTMMPCIILEPRGIPEEWVSFPNKKTGKVIIEIHCILEIFDNDKQFETGETAGKSILAFAEDVMDALEADMTIAGTCETFLCYVPENGFVYDYFPQREVIVQFEATKRFIKGARN